MSYSDESRRCRWMISDDSAGLIPQSSGFAPSASDAWSAAFAAGRAALLTGCIDHLAVAVDDEIPQLTYSPSRDRNGRLDPIQVSCDLEDLLEDVIRGTSRLADLAFG